GGGRVASQSNSPGPSCAGIEAQTLKRDRHQHHVSISSQPRLGAPNCVEAEIIVLAFGNNSFPLYPEWIHEEGIRPPPIVEGVERNADAIVIFDVLATAHMGT